MILYGIAEEHITDLGAYTKYNVWDIKWDENAESTAVFTYIHLVLTSNTLLCILYIVQKLVSGKVHITA